MSAALQTNNKQATKDDGPIQGLLRPPVVFLAAILSGIALNQAWRLRFMPSSDGLVGAFVTLGAVLLFLFSLREFRSAGTSVRGNERASAIVRTGPYRFSRNPIYLSFVLLELGLSIWLNDLWLLITLVPAAGFIAMVVIPKEERYLERSFRDQYASYKTTVRRWI
jgi:protein-S-isoprenylcysteine O-methyltransferase Ste14